jgi:hypothetical protein
MVTTLCLQGCVSKPETLELTNTKIDTELLFGNDTLYFQDNKGQLSEITRNVKAFNYDIIGNLVVFVSKNGDKLYLYNHANRIIRLLHSPQKYYVNSPMFYKQEVFYTIADNQNADPYPGWLYVTSLSNNKVEQLTDFAVNLNHVQFYAGLFIMAAYNENSGTILVNPATKQHIKISEKFPLDFHYEFSDDRLYFTDKNKQTILLDLNYWGQQIEHVTSLNECVNNSDDNIFNFRENNSVLYSKSRKLYFREPNGKLFEITDKASSTDYDASGNIVVYVSQKDGKLYLYNHEDQKIAPLNSPDEYFVINPKLYKNHVFYTVMNNRTDVNPAYLFVTDIRNGVAQEIIRSYIDMYSLLEYKNLYVLKGFGKMKLVLLDPSTLKYIGIPTNEKSLYNYVVKNNKLVSVDSAGTETEVVNDLDYWVDLLEKL